MKSKINFKQLDLNQLSAHRLFLLKGKEEVILKQTLNRITSHFTTPNAPAFHLQTLNLNPDSKADELIGLCEQIPLYTQIQVIICQDIQKLKEKEAAKLRKYLPDCSPHLLLILVERENPSTRKKKKPSTSPSSPSPTPPLLNPWETTLASCGLVVNCTLPEKETPDWIKEEFKKEKLEIEPNALKKLISFTGNDLSLLFQEIEKLKILASEKSAVTTTMVEELSSHYPSAKTSMLIEAIKTQNPQQGLTVLKDLFYEKTEFPLLFGYLLSAFRRMLKAKSELPTPRIHKFIDWLYRADLAIKTGKDADLVMETLIINMCR